MTESVLPLTGEERRKEFQLILEGVLGSSNVYFQPPSDFDGIGYPAIVYEKDNVSTKHADNVPYSVRRRYQVTYLSYTPNDDALDKLEAMPYSAFSRHFATSGLNHDVYVIYH